MVILMILCILILELALGDTDIAGQDSGGWYTTQPPISGDSFQSAKSAPFLSVPQYFDTDSYACGFSGSSKSNGYDGVWNLDIIFCHKYDTTVQSTQNLVSGQSYEVSFSAMCPSDQFVTSVQTKSMSKVFCPSNDGITGIKFRCSTFPGYSSGSHSSWIKPFESNSGSWDSIYYHSTKLICGGAASFGNEYCPITFVDDDYGVDGLKFQYCTPHDCRETIKNYNSIPDQQYYVNHGNTYPAISQYVYGEKQIYYGKFFDFWSNSNSADCPFTACSLVGSTSDIVLHNTWTSSTYDMLKINQDPTSEYSVILRVQCQNRETVSIRQSNLFTIKMSCSNNITIAVPTTFLYSQTGVATTVVASWNQFNFNSFVTYTSACQLDYYEVYTSESSITTPIGIFQKSYNEPQATGYINQRSFAVTVLNGEKPFQYKFKIKATAMGGNTFWTPELTLTISCPSEVPVSPQSPLSTLLTTCLGANLIGTGNGARFNFPVYVPTLPMCNQVLGYTMINVSPSSGVLSYPSSTCMGSICYTIDLDVSTIQTISFQIQINTQMNSGTSAITSSISINVQSACVALMITAPSVIALANNVETASGEYKIFIGTGTQGFFFSMFTCSTGCAISYTISPTTLGLGVPVYDLSKNMMKVAVDDTSLNTYTFKVYGYLTQQTSINAMTADIKLSIVCGSEQILVSPSSKSLVLNPFDLITGTSQMVLFSTVYTEFSSGSIRDKFTCSQSLCPLWNFSLYKDISFNLLWSSSGDQSYIQLMSGSTISSSYLTISIQTPFRQIVQIKGESEFGNYDFLSLDLTICGNEDLTSLALSSELNKLVFNKNDVYSIAYSTYVYWFELTNEDHPDCKEITYQLKQGINCDQTLDSLNSVRFAMSTSNRIEFDQSSPFDVQYICLQATTRGQIKAHQILKVEVCGSEILSLIDSYHVKTIVKLYNYNSGQNGLQSIYVGSEGFSFTSNRANCPPFSYRLLDASKILYQGSQISPSGLITDIVIDINTLTPLYQEIYYLEIASKNSPSVAYLPLKISICGYETPTAFFDAKN